MKTAVVNVSSLYPIDLTALAFHGIHCPHDQLLVALNDATAFDDSSPYREHVARAALPKPEWRFDQKGSWRQVHQPLSGRMSPGDGLAQVVEAWASALESTDGQIAAAIRRRGKLLTEQLDTFPSKQTTWHGLMRNVAERILREVVEHEVRSTTWSQLRRDSVEQGHAESVLRRIAQSCAESGGEVLFARGGYVAFSGHRTRYRAASFDPKSEVLYLHPRNGSPLAVTLGSHTSVPPEIVFGGPLEMALLSEAFTIVDSPWFGDHQAGHSTLDAWEYISPVVVHDERRVALGAGGGGMRLEPAGYTLLDYRHPAVSALVSATLGLTSRQTAKLVEGPWQSMMRLYPRASQKGAKSQSSVRAYRALIEEEQLRSARSSGRWPSLDKAPGPWNYGWELVNYCAVLRLIREIAVVGSSPIGPHPRSTVNPDPVPPTTEGIDLRALLELILETSLATGRTLDRWGLPKLEHHEAALTRILELAQALGSLDIGASRQWPDGLGRMIAGLRSLADAYFGFVLFYCTAILKANIFGLYLLLGAEDTRHAIAGILGARVKPRQRFSSHLWFPKPII